MQRILIGLVMLLALVVSACTPVPSTTPSTSQPKDKLKLPGVLSYELNLPSLVAVAEDYFGEENIEIEDFVLGSSTPLRNAVIAGEYDFGLFSFVHVPLARQANSPFRMVATTYEREVFSLIVRGDLRAEVTQVADLRGRRVGYSTPGSGAWAAAVTYLNKAGLDPSKDVELVSLGADASVLYTALQSGKVDALVSWEPATSRALTSGVAYPLVSIWDPEAHRQWLGADTALAEGLVTREDVIRDKPDLVRRMVTAHLKGLAFIRSNSAETIADTVLSNPMTKPQFDGLERPLVIDIIARIKPGFGTGCLSRSGFQVEMDSAVKYGIVQAPMTFEEFAEPTWAGACA